MALKSLDTREIRGYKFRIYPTKSQIKKIERVFYLNNRAWNKLLATYDNFRNELNLIPIPHDCWEIEVVAQNNVFNYFTKHSEGKKHIEIRNQMYFNNFLDHLVPEPEEGKKKQQYSFYNLFKNEEGDYYAPYNELPAFVLDQVIDKIKKAFDKMKTGAGYPKYKSYDKTTETVREQASFGYRYSSLNQNSCKFNHITEEGFHKITIPWGGKLKVLNKKGESVNKLIEFGELKIKFHRLLPSDHNISGYTISRDVAGKYYISFSTKSDLHDINKPIINPAEKLTIIGVDRNATGNHLTTSNEELNKIPYNKELLFDISVSEYELQCKLITLQKQLSKIQYNVGVRLFGDEFKKQFKKIPKDQLPKKYFWVKKQISLLHETIRNKKKDKINNIAHTLTNAANTIVFENLKVSNMIRKAKPKKDENGVYVKNGRASKKGLSKLIGRSNMYEIMNTTRIKGKQKNVTTAEINPAYTSRTCPECNHVNMDLKTHFFNKKNKVFVCQNSECGHESHSDLTAAIVIKNKYVQANMPIE